MKNKPSFPRMPRRRNRSRKKGYADAMADCVLPEDIMLCILTRLPVESVIRFKSVCEPWRDLLSTSVFIKMHQDQFSKNPENQSLIIHSLSKTRNSVSLIKTESNEKKSTILPENYRRDFIGCCNGLVCIGFPTRGPESVILWNPAMRLFKFVTLWKDVDLTGPEKVSLGFGYDDEGADFKVVRIACLKNEEERGESMSVVGVEVYSVNSDSWITIKPGFQFSVFLKKNGAIVNGNPYWVARVDGNESATNHFGEVLVRFDVKKLVFQIVPLSELNHNLEGIAVLPLVDWNGSLAVLVCGVGMVGPIVVWVFDDGEQIWRKNHTFGPIEMNPGLNLQCSKNGKIMGDISGGRLFLFDSDNGFVKTVNVFQASPFEIYPYTESLAYIKGMVLWRGGEGDYSWRDIEDC